MFLPLYWQKIGLFIHVDQILRALLYVKLGVPKVGASFE